MSDDTLSNKKMGKAMEKAEAHTAANFRNQHAASLSRIAAGDAVLVAHVTVGNDTLTVSANKVNEALLALHGAPIPGLRCAAQIEFATMSRAEFAALPEFQ